jgi:NAD(P)-dependent dehydrogenase (short-subunit alcohol dehydrogenase family)
MRLKERVAIITGGSRGIGRAITRALAREGANVAIVGQDKAHAEALLPEVRSLGVKGMAFAADVASVAHIEAAVHAVMAEFGRIDILVNNAGMGAGKPPLEVTEGDWDRLIDVNLKGVFFFCQKVAPIMVEQGSGKIINTTSMLAEIGMPRMAHYCATKAGVKLLTKSFAIDLAPHGIQVNAVGPGTVETDLNRAVLAIPSERQWRLERIPMKRLGLPEEIAAAVVFLASDDASYVTGQSIYVDGGRLA